jgi:hypothetical protein
MLARKTQLVNSGLTVNTSYMEEYGSIIIENTQRQATFGVEIKLEDAITFARMVYALIATDEEMAAMDAEYRENFSIGADVPF